MTPTTRELQRAIDEYVLHLRAVGAGHFDLIGEDRDGHE